MMLGCGFSAADAERTARANRKVDINIFRPFGSPAGAHYMKGEQVAAEKRIRDLMFTAVKEANKGNNTGALKSLGRALHTLQDKHAHYLQGIGNRDEHSKKDADNPLVNHRAWNEAWNDSMELIKMFKKLTSGGPDAADAADDYFEDYDEHIEELEEAEEAEREAEEEWHRNL